MDSIPHALREWAARRNDTLYRITIAAALGDRERAMALLHDRGYDRWTRMQYELEPLWDYPPFQEFIRPKR